MKVIKRNKKVEEFTKEKIEKAIILAMRDCNVDKPHIAKRIAHDIEKDLLLYDRKYIEIEELQDIVENYLMNSSFKDVAKHYIKYRYNRDLARKFNERNNGVLELLNGDNEELYKENSNKNALVISTQRDYMAGEVSKELVKTMFSDKIIQADRDGIIHLHDKDYIAGRLTNCGLVNLDDMLQNGTVISGIKIYKPNSFLVACNIATQIIAQVASNQFGGQSISMTHLAPFVKISRDKIRKQVEEEAVQILDSVGQDIDITTDLDSIVDKRLRKEIKDGCQLLIHQILTLQTSNGQNPFLTIFMYLNETEEYKEELAMIIEEMLNQRIKGLPNKFGKPITVAFPKLIYVLEEDNIREDSKYWYLTKLAVECSSKRLVPDYISEKKMKELKEGNCFPVMG